MTTTTSKRCRTGRRQAVVAAPPERIWEVLADFGTLARWVPMIQHSCLLTEQPDGIGTTRRVQLASQTLIETVDVWEPPLRLSYTIAGLPPVVGAARNTWTMRPAGRVTEVTLTTDIETGNNPAKWVIAGKVLERMSLASEFMLAGLQTEATQAPSTEERS